MRDPSGVGGGGSWFSRHRLLALLTFNAALFVGLGAAGEIALRLLAPPWLAHRMAYLEAGAPADGFGSDRDWKVIRNDGRFVSFVPGSRFMVHHNEFHTTATIDEFGGRRVATDRKGGPLVPCLGDSFTFGVGVEDDETFVSALQRSIDARLLNLGVPGAALPQQRFIVQNRHAALGRPAVYVSFFFLGNDFDDMIRTRENRYAAGPDQGSAHPTEVDETLAWRLNTLVNRSFWRRSYLLQYSKWKLMQIGAVRGKRDEAFLIMNAKNLPYQEMARNCLLAELDAWQVLARQERFKLLFVFLPDRYQVSTERRNLQAGYYGISRGDLLPTLPNRILAESLQARGIPYIDPTEAFQSADNPETLYYVNDNHFTPRGHALLAQVIATRLSAKIRDLEAAKE